MQLITRNLSTIHRKTSVERYKSPIGYQGTNHLNLANSIEAHAPKYIFDSPKNFCRMKILLHTSDVIKLVIISCIENDLFIGPNIITE